MSARRRRLRYRYIDLRRPQMQDRLRLRARITRAMRGFLDDHGFLDIETPMLTRSTPEGARDYLVPSRTHPGEFFALPQSPQLFKQLLMMGGVDRYYQVARCFRDEDLRADRQPEFTQLDIETSFMAEDGIMGLMETMIRGLFRDVLGVDLPDPFPRMTYHEAMRRFGTDRPDLRIPLELVDLGDLMQEVDFKVFSGPGERRRRARRGAAPAGWRRAQPQGDRRLHEVRRQVRRARDWPISRSTTSRAGRDGLQSPILKFLPDDVIDGDRGAHRCRRRRPGVLRRRQGQASSTSRSARCASSWVRTAGCCRARGRRCGWSISRCSNGTKRPTAGWRCTTLHRAQGSTTRRRWRPIPATPLARLRHGAERHRARRRLHPYPSHRHAGGAYSSCSASATEEARDKFGFLLDALRFGCPPHGGIAFGLDRLVMLMAGAQSIREVMAFPKTQTATCPLTDAPSVVAPGQLIELGIHLRKPPVLES